MAEYELIRRSGRVRSKEGQRSKFAFRPAAQRSKALPFPDAQHQTPSLLSINKVFHTSMGSLQRI